MIMNSFDKKQIEILTPLYEQKVVLHYAFFANTFPIAFHYTQLLKQKGVTKIDQFIKLHDWNNLLPSGTPEVKYLEQQIKSLIYNKDEWQYPKNINLFYASDINYRNNYVNPLKRIREYFEKKYKDLEFMREVPFTQYAPRFVFLKKNLFSLEIAKPNNCKYDIDTLSFKKYSVIKDDFKELASVLRKAKKNGIKRYIVYTDLVYEARDIFAGYKLTEENTTFYDKNDLGTVTDYTHKDRTNTLQIYYYGAPTSFDLLQKKDRYIPVIIDENKLHNGLKAVACLHYNSIHRKSIKSIEDAIAKYHNQLFENAAASDAPEQLNNVRLAYNRFASLIRHDTSFGTPESFSNCITLFNKSFSEPENELKDRPPKPIIKTQKDNYHFHFGAGRLSIGLVLPSFKTVNRDDRKFIYVLQKKRENWRKRIRANNDRIKLVNSHDYDLEFELYSKCPKLTENDTFVLYDHLEELEDLIKHASSISYSLNNKHMEKELIKFLINKKYKSECVFVFPFENNPIDIENDPEIIDQVKNHEELKFIGVKADRICLKRSFEANNTIKVDCEKYAEIVIDSFDDDVKSLFDPIYRSHHIRFASSKAEFNFLADRKKLLLNELHFILAIYGYDFLVSREIIHWENQYVTILQAALDNDSEYRIPIETFIKLQIIRLFLSTEYTMDTIKDLYNSSGDDYEILYQNLLKYAEEVKNRFEKSKEDLVSRVFNTLDVPTIKRKYKSIIKEIETFIVDRQDEIEKFPLVSGSTYGEFTYFLEDIKRRIARIFKMRVKMENLRIKEIDREHNEKKQDLKFYSEEIKQILAK